MALKRVELLVDNAFEPLFVLDPGFRVLAANRPARALFPDIDIVGCRLTDYFDDEDLIKMLSCAGAGQSGPPEIQFTFNLRVYRARCALTAAKSMGRPCLSLAVQDVTQLIRLNRARRDMVANISHELRTPISAIGLLHETINRPGAGKKQRQSILRKIGRQLDALQRIVEDMHDLSMMESGQTLLRLVPTPLLPLLEESLEHLEEQIGQRKIKVAIDVPQNLFVLVDGGQIGRVFTNLLDNAVKFTPKKGDIAIGAEIKPDKPDTILMHVSDSGPGIPPDERKRIFERFYQLDQARSMGRGSGLGLSIARHIIEAHNGRVWAKDSPLGGTSIYFTLLNTTSPASAEDQDIIPVR